HHSLDKHSSLLSAGDFFWCVICQTIVVVWFKIINIDCFVKRECRHISFISDQSHDCWVVLENTGSDNSIAPSRAFCHIICKYFRVKSKSSKCTCSWHCISPYSLSCLYKSGSLFLSL